MTEIKQLDTTFMSPLNIIVMTRTPGPRPATQERCRKDTPLTLSLRTNISKEQVIQKYAAFHNIQKYYIIQY